MDAPKVIFRSKMGGYNKEDVNNYISSENQRFKRAESDFQRTLSERNSELSRLNNELSSLRSEIAKADEKYKEQDKLIEGYKKTIDSLESSIEDMQDTITHLEQVKDDDIYQKSEVIIDENVFDKARSYDSLCTQIDEILSYAKSEADRIINTAIESAKRIERSRGGDVSRIKSEISAKSTSIIDDLRRTLRPKNK